MTLVLLFSQVTEHGKKMLKYKYRFKKCEILFLNVFMNVLNNGSCLLGDVQGMSAVP